MENRNIKRLWRLAYIGEHLAHKVDIFECQQEPFALAAIETECFFALVIEFFQIFLHGVRAFFFVYVEEFGALFEYRLFVKVR